MNNFPVKQLTADQIELSGNLLLDVNGNLSYNGSILAKYTDLVEPLVVADRTEFNLLTPKIGDIAKIEDIGESYIWNGIWIPLFKSLLNVYDVPSYSSLPTITNPNVGDIVNVINEVKSGIYTGTDWNFLLDSGIGATLQDFIVSTGATWSSSKISAELESKQDNITAGTSLTFDTDTLNLDPTDGIDMVDNDLYNTKFVTFSSLYDYGTKSTDWVLDPNNGVYQKVRIQENCRVIITQPTNLCTTYLHIYQGTLGTAILTFPSFGWCRGIPKKNTKVANTGHDLLMIHYYGDGNYVFEMIQDIV